MLTSSQIEFATLRMISGDLHHMLDWNGYLDGHETIL